MTLLHFRTALLALSVAALALTGCPGPDDEDPLPDAGEDAGDDGGDNGDGGDETDGGDEPDPDVETGGAASSEQIQAVRDVTDENATHDPALSVEQVAVTYIRTEIGNDPAGFFVQAEATGPALFIKLDPATLETELAVGDIVSFNVTGSTVANDQHQVTAIEGLTVEASGFDVATLVQDLSAATDIVTGLGDYESELIQVSAHMAGDIYTCSGPSQCNAITTEGIPAPESNLRFRFVPEAIEAHGLRTGCDIVIGPSPMWRFRSTAQVSAFVPEDVEVVTCLFAPSAAVALSNTQVRVTFNAEIDASTVTAESFTVTGPSGPLAVDAAVVEGDSVVLTTGAQASMDLYTITIAETAKDVDGWAVAAGSTVEFAGYLTPAVVRINEAELDGTSGCDLIELRVLESGPMGGFTLQDRNASTLLTFPQGFTVTKNDLIVFHVGSTNENCNGGVVPEGDETDGPETVAHPNNFPEAFDFWGGNTGISNISNTLRLYDATGELHDFVLLAPEGGSVNSNAIARTNDAVAVGQWAANPSGEPYTSADLHAAAARYDGQTETGTAQRSDDLDTNDASGWTQAATTMGALNVGQTALP